jgi:PiT family inorganic phosphate transporter
MATVAAAPTTPSAVQEKFSKGPGFIGTLIFIAVLVVGISYIGWSVSRDLANLHLTSALPYLLLGLALFVALAFEFVNGFHDTANAVATVIYYVQSRVM